GRRRRPVSEWVAHHAAPGAVAPVRLLVSELVTSAVVQGGAGESATIEIRGSADEDAVRVEVSNPGSGFVYEPSRPREPGEQLGRYGLYLVGKLAGSWGVETGSPTRVWFEVSRTTPPAAHPEHEASGRTPGPV